MTVGPGFSGRTNDGASYTMTPHFLIRLGLTVTVSTAFGFFVVTPLTARPHLGPVFRPAVPWSPRATMGGGRAAEGALPPSLVQALAPEDRQNVVLLDGDGIVYASRVAQTKGLERPPNSTATCTAATPGRPSPPPPRRPPACAPAAATSTASARTAGPVRITAFTPSAGTHTRRRRFISPATR